MYLALKTCKIKSEVLTRPLKLTN